MGVVHWLISLTKLLQQLCLTQLMNIEHMRDFGKESRRWTRPTARGTFTRTWAGCRKQRLYVLGHWYAIAIQCFGGGLVV